MRTIRCTITIAFLLTTVMASSVMAQSSRRNARSTRSGERAARAAWAPTRPSPTKSSPARSEQASRAKLPAPIRTVDHHEEVQGSLPAPANPPVSVIEAPIEPTPLDGQISLAPIHDPTVACDSLPPGDCQCGSPLCDGCDVGCDTGCCTTGTCGAAGCSMCGELCSPRAWRPCVTLCLPQDGWVSFEYLGWWQDGMNLPPLVTTSTDPNVPQQNAGVLGVPSTRVLFGNSNVLDDGFNGGRLRFGVWLDRCHRWGIGAEYFELGSEHESFTGTSTGSPVLARPFFNTQTGLQDSELVAFPGVLSGTVRAAARSQFSGAGFHVRSLRCCDEGCNRWLFCGCPEHYCSRTELRFGYRYLQLDEAVVVTENLVSTDTNFPGAFDIIDSFDVRNQFNGFDIGWAWRHTRGFWSLETLCRMGIGTTRQTVTINGQTTITDPANPPALTQPGGLLAQTTNIGTYRNDEFAVVPEFNLNLGYQLTDHLKMTLGYTFIYWSNVVRPGEQISLDVNPTLFPSVPPTDQFQGARRPAFAFDTKDFWAQGISFGGEYRW